MRERPLSLVELVLAEIGASKVDLVLREHQAWSVHVVRGDKKAQRESLEPLELMEF